MRINKNDQIAGIPIVSIRNMLRKLDGHIIICAKNISLALEITLDEAKHVICELEKGEFIEKLKDNTWKKTIKGNALSMATIGAGFLRKTAEQKLTDFLERVKELNKGDYAYKVEMVAVFGSYLTDAERLGDVDVAIKLKPTYNDLNELEHLKKERVRLAKHNGRSFSGIMDELFWPYTEVLQLLKSKCKVISIHDIEADGILEKTNYKVIYTQDLKYLSGAGKPSVVIKDIGRQLVNQ